VESVFLSVAEVPKLNLGAVEVASGALLEGVEVAVEVPNENVGVADPPSAGLLVRMEGAVVGLDVVVLLPNEKVGAVVAVDAAEVEGSDLRKLNGEDVSFFASDAVGITGRDGFGSDSAGFANEKSGLEAAADVAVGVLEAPKENPPEGFGASVFDVDDGVELDPNEKPETGTAFDVAGDGVEPDPNENPEADAAVDIAGAGVELAVPNENGDAAGTADVADAGVVTVGVFAAGIAPKPVPLPNAGLFNKAFWFKPLTSDTVRRNGD